MAAFAGSNYYVDPGSGSDITGDGSSGNPWASVQHALDNITRNTTNGDQINIKAGTDLVLTQTWSNATYGNANANAPCIFRGYTSTTEDGGVATIDMDATYRVFDRIADDGFSFVDLKVQNPPTDTNEYVFHVDNDCSFINVELQLDGKIGGINCGSTNVVANCKFIDWENRCIATDGANLLAYGNWMQESSTSDGSAINMGAQGCQYPKVFHNVISLQNAGSKGILYGGNSDGVIAHNTVYNSAAGTEMGIYISRDTREMNGLIGNYIEGFSGVGGAGIEINSATDYLIFYMAGNRFYNNTTNVVTGAGTERFHYYDEAETAESSSILTNPGSDDFTPTAELLGSIDEFASGVNSRLQAGAMGLAGGSGSITTIINQIRRMM